MKDILGEGGGLGESWPVEKYWWSFGGSKLSDGQTDTVLETTHCEWG